MDGRRAGQHARTPEQTSHPLCFIIPPNILKGIAKHGTEKQRDRALRDLSRAGRFRERRRILGRMSLGVTTPTGELRRTVYDANRGEQLPGTRVRGEGDSPTKDVETNEAYDGAGSTYNFYEQVFNRNSIDDRGMRLDSTVHYSEEMDNAFWDGTQMVYGDGDGEIFTRFTVSVDVIGHEMTHGVTQLTANLDYHDQSGALNESMSDVFGSLVKQWTLQQTAENADWLIGEGLLMPNINGQALRSMKAPGTAFDDPVLGGKDPQPDRMSAYLDTSSDNGGVHLNSGIPNRAFYLTAAAIGGYSWEKAGTIWYRALTQELLGNSQAQFLDAANATLAVAGELYGEGSPEQAAVKDAWTTVEVLKPE
jgi:Zn-dependent metalloprotease